MTKEENNPQGKKAGADGDARPDVSLIGWEGDSLVHRLVELGIALSAERNTDRLLEKILLEAKGIYDADGGTLYLTTDAEDGLAFEIMRNDTLNVAMGGTTGQKIPFPAVPLFKEDGRPNLNNVASAVWHSKTAVNILDAYTDTSFDFSGTKRFDAQTGYRSQSFLTVPLINADDEVIGVLQLINARDAGGNTVTFDPDTQSIVEALSSQAAVALENSLLISAQRRLWDALIEMLAAAIDDKSPYTGGHCQRVPVITKMLVDAACSEDEGVFEAFSLTEDEWYELHVAAWLHDCGKVTTPEFVVDKSSKLETIYNRIHEVRTRFEVLHRDAEIECLKAQLDGVPKAEAEAAFEARCAELQEEFAFVATANVGGEFMDEADIERLQKIAGTKWIRHFDKTLGLSPLEEMHLTTYTPPAPPHEEPLLGDLPEHAVGRYNMGELYNLSIRRGTLTEEERKTINDHIVVTIKMLEQLPFPKKMRRVAEFAGGHHEKMDGTGYPNKLKREEMSLPARVMAIADIYEALTAADRPYKKAKTISESLRIMSFMVKDAHIDPDLFALFLRSGVWRDYAEQYLQPQQIDDVNIDDFMPPAELLAAAE